MKNHIVAVCVAIAAIVLSQGIEKGVAAEGGGLEQAKVGIRDLLKAGDWGGAEAAIAQMKASYSGDANLAAAINYAAGEYRWVNRFEDAIKIYAEVNKTYPGSAAAARARLGIAEVEIVSLLETERFAEAEKKRQEFLGTFGQGPEVIETLYWLAGAFEGRGRYDAARDLYWRVMTAAPDFKYIETARFNWRAFEPFSLAEAGKDTEAFACADRLIADYPDRADTAKALLSLGWKYWADRKAENYAQKAIAMYDKVLTDLRTSEEVGKLYADVYYLKGMCYAGMNDYRGALESYQKVVSDYPDFIYVAYCQYMVGATLVIMRDEQILPAEEADARAKAAFETFLAKYPGNAYAEYARMWLESLNAR